MHLNRCVLPLYTPEEPSSTYEPENKAEICQTNSKTDESLRAHDNEKWFPEQKHIHTKNSYSDPVPMKMTVPKYMPGKLKSGNEDVGQEVQLLMSNS